MELKQTLSLVIAVFFFVLIVPSGIETRDSRIQIAGQGVLIVPSGIETPAPFLNILSIAWY